MGTSQFGVEGDIDMGRNNSSRLTVRFVIVLLVAMLPSVGMVVFNALKLKKYHTEEAVEALQWSVGEISRHHLHEIRATHTLFYSLAQMPEVRRPDATACQALFAELQGLSRFYDNIGLVGKDGYVLASAVPFSGQVYVGDREHVQQAIQSRDFATSKLQMGRILQKPSLVCTFPVLDGSREVQGVLFGSLGMAWLVELMKEAQLPSGSNLTITDDQGNVLVHYPQPEELIGKTLPPEVLEVVRKKGKGTLEAVGMDQVRRLYVFTSLGNVPRGYALAGSPVAVLHAAADKDLRQNLVIQGLSIGLALGLAWIMGLMSITRPVHKLVGTADQLARGNLTVRVGSTGGSEEFAFLSQAFDRMAESLQRRETERSQAERLLRESEERYRTLFDDSRDGVYATTRDGKFLEANKSFLELLGYDREDLMAMYAVDLYVDPSDRLRFQDLIEHKGYIENHEVKFHKKDGTAIDCLITSSLKRDKDGTIVGYQGIIRDVTKQKQMEEALRQSEQTLRTLVDAHPDSVLLMDTDGTILVCSRATAQRLGKPMQEVIGSCVYDYLPTDAAESRRKRVQEVIHTGRPLRFEDTRFGRTMDNRIQPVTDAEGKVVRLVILGIDITERRKALEVQKRLATAIEQSAEAVVITNSDGVIQYVNPATEQITGFERSEIIGNTPRIFKSGEHDKAFYEQLWNAIKAGNVWSGRFINKKKDGSLYHEDATISPVRDASGAIMNFVAVKRDVTERQRAEEALRVQTERFRAVVDQAPFGMVMIGEDGTYQYVNPRFTEMFGYELSDVPNGGQWFRRAFPDPAYRKEVIRAWLDDVKYAPLGQTRPRIFSVTCKDGSSKLIHFRPVRLRQGEDLITLEDITERAKAEEALRESEERMRRLVESSPVGLGIVQDGKYAYANPALVTILGAGSPDEIVGASPLAFIVPEDRDLVRQRGKQRLEGLNPAATYQVGGLRKNGERFEASIWPTRIDYSGKPALLSFVADVTEQNKLKAQLLQAQKMEAIGTLAGGIAHDFNNLLQVCLGYSEFVLADEDLPQHHRDDLTRVYQATEKGADLVRRLLAFSRKAESNPRPVDLNRVIEQLQKMISRMIPKMVETRLDLRDDVARIHADPGQMEQILMNLAVNARDAMPDGGTLIFKTENETLDEQYCRDHLGARPGRYVLLSVSDTGKGMDKETLAHIFEPFFTTKGLGEGTGLGLAVVYGIVKQHNGYIMCYSEPGAGTTFKIYLPALVAETAQSTLRTREATPKGGTETILLVDDEEDVQEFATRILTQVGYTVLSAANGKEALEVYQREGPHISLVILDIIMPEMGGKECLKELLRTDPNVKVLVASGFVAEDSVKETVQMGAKGFVQKPFGVRDLCGSIRKVLDER